MNQEEDMPTFAPIFGAQWQALPPALRAHYANRPYSRDVVTVTGKMTLKRSLWMRLLSPLLRMANALVPYDGEDIPVTVHYRSEPHSAAYCFDRLFHFEGRAPYRFRSRMFPGGGSRMIDFMRFNIGWRGMYHYEDGKVRLRHAGYVWRLGKRDILLPLEWLIGRSDTWEVATGENSFRMYMEMRHRLFGTLFSYGGDFTVQDVRYER